MNGKKKDILRGIDRENGKPEKSDINKKESMIDWIIDWLDDDLIEESEREDIFEFLKQFKS